MKETPRTTRMARVEVYVLPFAAGAKTQLSTTAGWNTILSRDHELFFVVMETA